MLTRNLGEPRGRVAKHIRTVRAARGAGADAPARAVSTAPAAPRGGISSQASVKLVKLQQFFHSKGSEEKVEL